MPIKDRFVEYLTKRYPNLQAYDLKTIIADQLISPFSLQLPKKILDEANECAQALFELRKNPIYVDFILNKYPEYKAVDIHNYAICNSLDFHYNPTQGLKLIEVNTNAAFLAMGLLMYDFKQIKKSIPFEFSNFIQSVLTEYELLFNRPAKLKDLKVAIVDFEPLNQRLSIEFLIYKELFTSHGISCDILDYRDPKIKNYNFIYNRNTDFFLNEPDSSLLKSLYLSKEACVSPHPIEYAAIADKSLFQDWETSEYTKKLMTFIPHTKSLSAAIKDQVWSDRKKYFFKPKNAFGSKQTFRGSSISRKAFEDICNENFIAQEFLSPGEVSFELNQETYNFKYDLRFHFYQDQLQMATARFYQGQVTNLKTPLGGFATVEFI